MKCNVFCLFFFTALFSLQADEEEDIAKDAGPFHVRADYEWVGDSRIDKKEFRGEHFRWSLLETEAGSIIYFNFPCKEGLDLTINYDRNNLHWNQNPFFNQRNFNTVGIRLAGFSHRLSDWFWRGFVKASIEADHLDFNHYLMWDFALWGRYSYSEKIGLHTGFYAEAGMKADHVYPVLGFDWKYSDCVTINCIFPMDISCLYVINKTWDAGLAVHFLHTRHRTTKDQPLSQAIWEYWNYGLELGLNYRHNAFSFANIHVGYTAGGKMRISNKHRGDPTHICFDGAPYAGAEIDYRF